MIKLSDFEQKLLSGFNDCTNFVSFIKIGLAVSGGADSISLLIGFSNLRKYFVESGKSLELHVIPINHTIRPQKETAGDAEFVQNLCKSLDVSCTRIDIDKGSIFAFADENKCGIEAAARNIRYKAFDSFIETNNIDYLCLAHNQNDQIETVLMRFLQGSGTGELAGIPKIRGKYIRPLLGLSRNEIESYLDEKKVDYRTDSTNEDVTLKRNLIRREIIPFVNEKFPGWSKSVLNLSKKSREDEDFIQAFVSEGCLSCELKKTLDGASFLLERYLSLHEAVKRRLLYKAFDFAGDGSGIRISYGFLVSINELLSTRKPFFTSGMEYEISFDGMTVLIRMLKPVATESSFFVIIEEDGCYEASDWRINSKQQDSGGVVLNISNAVSGVEDFVCKLELAQYPFAFRSKEPSDCIKSATGSFKPVSKILKDWKVENVKNLIPVIQNLGTDKQELVAVLGKMFGYSNWVVSN